LSQKFDFVVRTNVSTYFNDLKLREELMKFHSIQEPLALGFWEIHKRPDGLEERFLSGTGIIMNYSCAKIISETESDSYKMVPDDIAISREIKKKNVKVIPIRRCNLHKSKVFSNSCFIRLKSSERANLASSRMKLVNEYFIANKRSQRLRIRIKITCMEFRYMNWNFSEIRRYAVDIYVLIRLYLINSRLRLGK